MSDLEKMDHHAYLVVGHRESAVSFLYDIFEKNFKIQVKGNPDVTILDFEALGIDESRALGQMQSVRPMQGEKKIIVVCAYSATLQAQNSLLKIFEEPTPSTHFFLVVPSASFLIPTLLSRLSKMDFESEEAPKAELSPKKFLASTEPARIKMVESFLKKFKDSKENKAILDDFFHGMAHLLHADLKKNAKHLERLLELKKYIFDTSASPKILLETLSLVLPRIES